MIKPIVFIAFVLGFATPLPGQSDCYSRLLSEGKRLEQAGRYTSAIAQYKAAQGCPGLGTARELEIVKSIERAQERQLRAVEQERNRAAQAQKEAEQARVIAEERKREAEAQTAIAQQLLKLSEANRLAFLAERELERGDSLDGLTLAFLAYQSIEDQLIPNVKLTFGEAVRINYQQEAGEPSISLLGAIAPNGRHVVFPAPGNRLYLWEKRDGTLQPVTVNGQHQGPIRALIFSADSRFFLSGSEDQTAVIWDVTGRKIQTLRGHTGEVSGLAISPAGDRILTWSRDGTAKLWDFTGRLMASLDRHRAPVLSGAFSPDGNTILTRSADHSVMLWDGWGIPVGWDTPIAHPGHVYTAAFSPDSRKVLTGSINSTAKYLSIPERSMNDLAGHLGIVTSADFSFDSQFVITGGEDGKVQVRTTTGQLINTFQAHNNWITQVGFSPVSHHFFTVSKDQTIKLWNLKDDIQPTADGRKPILLDGHTGPVRSARFSPDGQQLLSYARDGMVKLWDLAGDVVFNYAMAEPGLVEAACSADGSELLIIPLGKPPVLCTNPGIVYRALRANPPPPLTPEKRERYGIIDENSVIADSGDGMGPGPAPVSTGGYKIQLGAFGNASGFEAAGMERFGPIETARIDRLTRFFIGGFASHLAAERVLPEVKRAGFPGAFIVSPPTDQEDTVTPSPPTTTDEPQPEVDILTPKLPLTPAPPTSPVAPAPAYKVQIAALSDPSNFENYRSRVAPFGTIEKMVAGPFTRILIGGMATEAEARRVLQQARSAGFTDAFIVMETNGTLKRVR